MTYRFKYPVEKPEFFQQINDCFGETRIAAQNLNEQMKRLYLLLSADRLDFIQLVAQAGMLKLYVEVFQTHLINADQKAKNLEPATGQEAIEGSIYLQIWG